MPGDPIPALKEQVAAAIRVELERHYAAGAALLIGIDLPRVSDLKRGRLRRFSLESLIRFATRLGLEVEITCSHRGLNGGSGSGPER